MAFVGITLLFAGLSLASYSLGQIKAQENASPIAGKSLSYLTKSFAPKPDATNEDTLNPIYPFSTTVNQSPNTITIDNINYYSGQSRQELVQSIRELCAFQLKKNNTQWLDFVNKIAQSCNLDNNSTCWKEQAVDSGFLEEEITQCMYKNAKSIITSQLYAQAQRPATPF